MLPFTHLVSGGTQSFQFFRANTFKILFDFIIAWPISSILGPKKLNEALLEKEAAHLDIVLFEHLPEEVCFRCARKFGEALIVALLTPRLCRHGGKYEQDHLENLLLVHDQIGARHGLHEVYCALTHATERPVVTASVKAAGAHEAAHPLAEPPQNGLPESVSFDASSLFDYFRVD